MSDKNSSWFKKPIVGTIIIVLSILSLAITGGYYFYSVYELNSKIDKLEEKTGIESSFYYRNNLVQKDEINDIYDKIQDFNLTLLGTVVTIILALAGYNIWSARASENELKQQIKNLENEAKEEINKQKEELQNFKSINEESIKELQKLKNEVSEQDEKANSNLKFVLESLKFEIVKAQSEKYLSAATLGFSLAEAKAYKGAFSVIVPNIGSFSTIRNSVKIAEQEFTDSKKFYTSEMVKNMDWSVKQLLITLNIILKKVNADDNVRYSTGFCHDHTALANSLQNLAGFDDLKTEIIELSKELTKKYTK